MAIVGAECNFEYAPQAGACGLFKASLYHTSVPPVSTNEHIKIAFFFRAAEKKKARVKRPAEGASADEPASRRASRGSR